MGTVLVLVVLVGLFSDDDAVVEGLTHLSKTSRMGECTHCCRWASRTVASSPSLRGGGGGGGGRRGDEGDCCCCGCCWLIFFVRLKEEEAGEREGSQAMV